MCSVQSHSRIQLFATPSAAACQASLSVTNSKNLLKLMSIESVMPSNHLILCHPLLLLPSILPSIRVFSNESVLHIKWPKYNVWYHGNTSYCQPRQYIKKQSHFFANKCPFSQGYGFSSAHVWMWELDYKESWVLKNWCFWTVVLKKTFESPLECKEIQPVHPKGNQSWMSIGRTDVEAETPILWPPDAKNWLIS